MNPYVICYVDECRHNQDRKCTKKVIFVGPESGNEFKDGERVCYPACREFEEAEDDNL